MKKADWLIVAGVMLIPTALFVGLGTDALMDYLKPAPNDPGEWRHFALFSLLWFSVAISAGLIATGVLMRKRSSN